ncbi:MAG TPA: WG repeat-containing protein [Spirochaetota bacterium]|nr:WG repeat-containing protein [Spirochaetota bacterium]
MKIKMLSTIIAMVFALILSGSNSMSAEKNVIWLIKPGFFSGSDYYNGLARVQIDNRRSSSINLEGKYVDPVFHEGLTSFRENNKVGFKDAKGRIVIKPLYVDAWYFSGGFARAQVMLFDAADWVNKNMDELIALNVRLDQMANASKLKMKGWGFINKEGVFISKPEFSELTDFSEGIAAGKKSDKWCCIDTNGKFITQFDFTLVKPFSEGLAAVYKDKKWGYINKDGKLVIEPEFNGVCNFYMGIAKVHKGNKAGYINRDGKFVIKPKYSSIGDFHDGLAYFNDGGKWGYMNREGKIVIEAVFSRAGNFSEGVAVVEKDGKRWVIDKNGDRMFDIPFVAGSVFSEGLLDIYENGKNGYIDKEGNVVIDPQFDDAGQFKEGVARVKKNGKYGYIVNPLSSGRQEKFLENSGLVIGEVKSISKSEIIVKKNDSAKSIAINDSFCLFSGGKIAVLRQISSDKGEMICEVISGKMQGVRQGLKVYKYKTIETGAIGRQYAEVK